MKSTHDMQGMSTFHVLDAFDRQEQEEAAGEPAQRHSFGMEDAENDESGQIAPVIEESLERGAVASESRQIAMFCASRVHDLRDIVDVESAFLTFPLDAATRKRYQELATKVLRLLLGAKEAEKRTIDDSEADSEADSAAVLSALDAQIAFLARALSADDDGAYFGSGPPLVASDSSDEPHTMSEYHGGSYIQPVDHKVPPVNSRVLKPTVDNFADSVVNYGHMATWDVRRAIDMSHAFSGIEADSPAMKMCADLSFWDTRRVTTMAGMFQDAVAFNGKIGTWHTASVRDMSAMFLGASIFNQDIGSWMTGNATIMAGMFQGAAAFDMPIGGWKTGATENMSGMFANASAFNQPIGDWDVTSVVDMKNMFFGATLFNRDLSKWRPKRTTLDTKIGGMFHGSGFNHADAIIGAWKLSDYLSREAGLPLRGSSVPSFGMRGRGRAFV